MEDKLNSVLEYLQDLKEGQGRFEKQLGKFGERQDRFNEKLDSFGERQDRFDEKLDSFGERQDRFDEKQDDFDGKLVGFGKGLDFLAESQYSIAQNQKLLIEGQNRTDDKLDNLTTEMRSGFRNVQSQLDSHNRIFKIVSDRFNHIH